MRGRTAFYWRDYCLTIQRQWYSFPRQLFLQLGMPVSFVQVPFAQLPVRNFALNVGNCREDWPWKREAYYSGLVLCRDSDHFPGLELEGDMEYAD